ncbi:MAG: hypothetical protein KGI14_06100, partial [Acidobacteriota bacterium]|nr:hypothetical protein [Acidobacteriota bacterium]
SLEQLVGEHESIRRSVQEVNIPRMTREEIFEIIDFGLVATGMTMDARARLKIARLSEGLPHYAHSLALRACEHAVFDDRLEVQLIDVKIAIEEIISSHSLRLEYQVATQSSHQDAIFEAVLVSCALAEKDKLGFFSNREVGNVLENILSRRPQFSSHLAAFSSNDRGNVLQRDSAHSGSRFRFRNPLLQPFAVMVAISTGVLPENYLDEDVE